MSNSKKSTTLKIALFLSLTGTLAPQPSCAYDYLYKGEKGPFIHAWMRETLNSEMRYLFDGSRELDGLTTPSQTLTIDGEPKYIVTNEKVFDNPPKRRIVKAPRYSLKLNKEALYQKFVETRDPVGNNVKNVWQAHCLGNLCGGWNQYFAIGSGVAVLTSLATGLATGYATGSLAFGLIAAGAPLVLFFGLIPTITALVGVAKGNSWKNRAKEIFDAQPDHLSYTDHSKESVTTEPVTQDSGPKPSLEEKKETL